MVFYDPGDEILAALVALGTPPELILMLGEATGAGTAVDASGNGHDGTYGGGPTLGLPAVISGANGTCASFAQASSQSVSVGDVSLA